MSSRLETLPVEILQDVAAHVSAQDLVMLSSVSKKLRNVLGSSNGVVWFHKVRVDATDFPKEDPTARLPGLSRFRSPFRIVTWPHETPDKCLLTFDAERDYRQVVLDYLSGASEIEPRRCCFCFSLNKDAEGKVNMERATFHKFNSADPWNEGEVVFSLVICRPCEGKYMTGLVRVKSKLWDADITRVPFWRKFISKYSGVQYVSRTSQLKKAVTAAHGGRRFSDVVAELETEYYKQEQPFLDEFVSAAKQELELNTTFLFESQFIRGPDVEEYLRSEWKRSRDWFFCFDREKRENEFIVAGRTKTRYNVSNAWSDATQFPTPPETFTSQSWITNNAISAVKYMLQPECFFYGDLTLRHYSGDGGHWSLPPMVRGLWRAVADKFTPEQADQAGKCRWCGDVDRANYSEPNWLTPFQYALHVFWYHRQYLTRKDVVEWRESRATGEAIVRRTATGEKLTDFRYLPRDDSCADFPVEWDAENGRMVMTSEDLYIISLT